MRGSRSLHGALVVAGLMLSACAEAPPPGPRMLQLQEGLSVLALGPIEYARGALKRQGGVSRAGVELQSFPGLELDVVAHWRREDGAPLLKGPADARRIASGPTGFIAMEFIAPSSDGRSLVIEIAPAPSKSSASSRS